jgi:tetratricopeptide (TPR) repeat protein
MRALERVVISRWIYAISGTDREDGIEALQTLTNSWIEDFYYVGPKSLLMAALLEASGKRETARLNYDAALTETRTRQAREPGNLRLQNVETSALLGLGRLDEARAANRVVMESVRRPYRYDPFETWWFSEIPRCLLLGERETALQLLREAAVGEAATPSGRIATWSSHIGVSTILRTAMKQDPRMAPFRDDPEIVALLAEPKKETADAPLSEAAQLAARAKAMFIKFAYTREDLASAEELARRATEKEPDNAAAWGVRAAVNGTYLQRNWDLSEKRLQETQNAANRALGLNPDEVEGLWARGYVFYRQGAYAQAEENLRRAVALAPTNNRMGRALAIVIGAQPGREEESRQILLDVVKRDPRDSLVRYELAGTYLSFGGGGDNPDILANALLHLDAGIAAQPLGSLLLLKAVLLGGWRGDFAGMRASLDELEKRPLAERTEDRAVYLAMWTSLLEHNVPRFNAAANLTAKNYFEDSVVPRRPKDWSLALAHRVEGKENLARLDWQRAETAVRERLRSDPNNQLLTYELATTLAWLGRNEEAARLIEPIEAAWREEPTRPRNRNLASFYAALGDAAKAAPYLNAGLDGGVFFTRKVVPLDPWFDKIRGAPEFAAAIKEKPAPKK